MNENYRCGDHEALIAFVYGEGDEGGREAVAAHLAECPACAEEVEGLRSTRAVLAQWTPPETSLGFRVTGAPEAGSATVLRPAAWWRQPLPAWAQAAAAVLIFAAGMTLGARQQPAGQVASGPEGGAAAPAATRPRAEAVPTVPASAAPAPAVSREDFARLERRLGAMERAGMRPVSVRTAAATGEEPAMVQRLEAMIAASEERQRAESARLVEAVARNIAAQRQYDLQQVERRIGQVYSTTDETLRQHSTAINSLVFASFPQPSAGR